LKKSKEKFKEKRVEKIKKFVMSLTIGRIIGAFSLLIINALLGLHLVLYVVYFICVLTDFIDGPIARKFNVTSDRGAFLDSVADMILVLITLIVFLPHMLPEMEVWMLVMIGIILVIRFTGFIIGFIKYRTFTLLHTYANKAAGALLGLFPIGFATLGLAGTIIILFSAQLIASTEELTIMIRSKELERNVKSFFTMKKSAS